MMVSGLISLCHSIRSGPTGVGGGQLGTKCSVSFCLSCGPLGVGIYNCDSGNHPEGHVVKRSLVIERTSISFNRDVWLPAGQNLCTNSKQTSC